MGRRAATRTRDKLKTLKWNFNMPRKEHVEQLKDQLQPCVSSTLFAQLFHDDFKKHIVALDTLIKVGVVVGMVWGRRRFWSPHPDQGKFYIWFLFSNFALPPTFLYVLLSPPLSRLLLTRPPQALVLVPPTYTFPTCAVGGGGGG